MYGNSFSAIGDFLIVGMIALVILIGIGIYSVVDFFWLPEKIRTTELITPSIELRVTDNKIDTIYVYSSKP